jgi:hypothetical protein
LNHITNKGFCYLTFIIINRDNAHLPAGNILINGNKSKIEEHKGVIGFVPQEDIVYSDLTVRENLMYAGRLQLPAGTTNEEISDLADATLAALGLCRIANSLVGDARRRGVSGGEVRELMYEDILEMYFCSHLVFTSTPSHYDSEKASKYRIGANEEAQDLVLGRAVSFMCVYFDLCAHILFL